MKNTYPVKMNGTTIEKRYKSNNKLVRESLAEIIKRTKNARRNARLVNIITR